MTLLGIACSSSNNGGSSGTNQGDSGSPPSGITSTTGTSCTVSTTGCSCEANVAPNDFACDSSSVGTEGYCCAAAGWPSSGTCECETSTPSCGLQTMQGANGAFTNCACGSTAFLATEKITPLSTVTSCYPGGLTSPGGKGSCCLATNKVDGSAFCSCTTTVNDSCIFANEYTGKSVTSCPLTEPGLSTGTCATGTTKVTSCSSGGGSSDGGASSTTCVAGSKTIYECCALAGGACESLDAYAACCESATCGSAKLIACLAAYAPSSVDVCTAALKACGG